MSNIINISLRAEPIPQPTTTKEGNKWIKYGGNNLYPEFLFENYNNCSLLKSLVDGISQYVSGKSISVNPVVNSKHETLRDIVDKCVSDYILFGAFSLQVLRNGFGNVSEIYHIDVRKVRLGNPDNGNGDTIYYSRDWSKSKYKKIAYALNSSVSSTSIYYFKNNISRTDYGTPMYHSAIRDVITLSEISNFHLTNIRNCFVPSALVNFNNGKPTEEEMAHIEKQFEKKFTGTDQASRIMLTFSDSKDNGVTIERLESDDFDSKYLTLYETCTSNLYVAFRAQPILFGLNPDHTAFNSIEYSSAFRLFQETVISPIQDEITRAFAKVGFEFEINKFDITFEQ